MCGIAGIACSRHRRLSDMTPALTTMAEAMQARGPDDQGVLVCDTASVGFVSRRLAIRDLSPAGHMPMCNPGETVWITYNGEIYNADPLRAQLETLGYAFTSSSDTEVILHGYEEWGPDVFDRLRGMFALAIYDRRSVPTLVLARDPLGIKPLYYAANQHTLAFASECKVLRDGGFASAALDPTALVTYFEFGSVPAPQTIYRDVRSLEAGQYLSVNWDAGGALHVAKPVQYWSLSRSDGAQRVAYAEAVERTRAALMESVRLHLVSDVPLGAFLSGGLDSASIVALMREASPSGVIRTCSVIFDEQDFSEESYAAAVSEKFGTEHVTVPVRAADMHAELERVIAALDQPSIDGVNTYFVSKAARQAGLTVALSGLGGDELFGGYPTFRRLPDVARTMRVVNAMPGATRVAQTILAGRGPHRPAARVASWLDSNGSADARAYLALRGLFSKSELKFLVRPDVLAETDFGLETFVSAAAGLDVAGSQQEAVSRLELTAYMRHQLLRDTDVMSMAHSLEVRVPFVDRELIERVLGIGLLTRPGALSKQVLRDAVAAVPGVVRDRRDKQGFTFPFAIWLGGPLRPRLEEIVYGVVGDLHEYLQPGSGERILSAFHSGRAHWSRAWALAALATVR